MDGQRLPQPEKQEETAEEEMLPEEDDEQMFEEVVEVDVEGEEDGAQYSLQEDSAYRVVYPSRTNSTHSASTEPPSYDSKCSQVSSEGPGGSQSYSYEADQTYTTQGRRTPAHVFAVRGNRIYRIDRSGGSTTTTPVRTLSKKCPGSAANKTDPALQEHEVISPKSVRTGPVSPPLAYRANQASFRHNRMFTPMLTAKLAPKKRPLGSRKPCHCTRSMCLKLYCDCFANGEFCKDCDCKDCKNTIEHEVERTRAIRLSLERNPNAFKPKIGVATNRHVEPERLHQKGCHCKKSNCLKNYCECYEAKVPCTDRCKCVSCRNTEADRAARFPSTKLTAALTDIRAPPATSSADSQSMPLYSDEDSDEDIREPSDPKTLPWFYMTDEVVEAATLCLVAQAEEMESNGKSTQQEIEKAILKEFGRCLGQVIDSALKNANKVADS